MQKYGCIPVRLISVTLGRLNEGSSRTTVVLQDEIRVNKKDNNKQRLPVVEDSAGAVDSECQVFPEAVIGCKLLMRT